VETAITSRAANSEEGEAMPVAWDDILSSFEFVSHDGFGNQAFVCRETGAVYWRSAYGDEIGELPDDMDSGAKYLAIPGARDLDLGARLVMRFADEVFSDHADKIATIFSRKGAYARFKNYLARIGALDQWHEFANAAREKALREWWLEHGLDVEG
jgi:hypothetical protein